MVKREMIKAARKRMQRLLAEIEQEYDFSQFSLEGFARWLEGRRDRPVVFVPWSMAGDLFGAWMAASDRDFIFYESDTPPVHQAHIQLHEMSHILCNHPVLEVAPQQVAAMLQGGAESEAYEGLMLRSAHSDEAEVEAEVLTSLIQEKVIRLQKLPEPISSDREIAAFIQALELA